MPYKIFFYNSLSNKLEQFNPLDSNNITMYVCGPTVYNYIHIGNARPLVVFDVLFRLLRFVYGESKVTYARNITDIDDKIIAQAQLENTHIDTITEKYINYFINNTLQLNILPPTHQPRATEYILEIQQIINRLLEKGFAYVASNKNVYFNVERYNQYGKLSNNKLDQMLNGVRVDVQEQKNNPLDFVLWKPSNNTEPGWDFKEIGVYGRPGWHIECSAMVGSILGDQIDIHAGGKDLLFPHHENENAQSCCAHNTPNLANYWLHNGFITVNGQKMSKSLGNYVVLNDLLNKYSGDVIKIALLSTHYRQNMDISDTLLESSKKTINKFNSAFTKFNEIKNNTILLQKDDDFINYLCNDLNTAGAISVLHTLLNTNTNESLGKFVFCANLMGVNYTNNPSNNNNVNKEYIEQQIIKRIEAKSSRNYQLADEIRNELLKQGITLVDTKDGTTWKTN